MSDPLPQDRRGIIRTPDQRLRVFVSSTLQELADERAAARKAIEHLRLTPVLFEMGARPHPPRDLYHAYLNQSHVIVVLRGGTRDFPERQQTLRKAIDWSYDLLNDQAKKLFQRLSVFAGGWTLEAAEAVCNLEGDLSVDVVEEMESLLDNNLLTQSVGEDGEMRFSMLETIREYAMERLLESGELDNMRQDQAQFYLALVERAEPELTTSSQMQWVNQLTIEHGSIRAERSRYVALAG